MKNLILNAYLFFIKSLIKAKSTSPSDSKLTIKNRIAYVLDINFHYLNKVKCLNSFNSSAFSAQAFQLPVLTDKEKKSRRVSFEESKYRESGLAELYYT